jgi:hypothetical protein
LVFLAMSSSVVVSAVISDWMFADASVVRE